QVQGPGDALLPRREAGCVQDGQGRRLLGADPDAVLRPGPLLPGRNRQLRQLRVGRWPSTDGPEPPRPAPDREAGAARDWARPPEQARAGSARRRPAAPDARHAEADAGRRLASGEGPRTGQGRRALRALAPESPVLPDLLTRRKDAGALAGAGHEHARGRVPAGRCPRVAGLLQAACVCFQARPPRTGDADLQGPAALIAARYDRIMEALPGDAEQDLRSAG